MQENRFAWRAIQIVGCACKPYLPQVHKILQFLQYIIDSCEFYIDNILTVRRYFGCVKDCCQNFGTHKIDIDFKDNNILELMNGYLMKKEDKV